MRAYDSIAEEYRDSKQLPFRDHLERYTLTNADGRRFLFDNFYLTPETCEVALHKAGFKGFGWVDVRLHPSQKGNPFRDDFLSNPPIPALTATR